MSIPSHDEHGRPTYHDVAVPVVAAHLRLEDELRAENEHLRAIVRELADSNAYDRVIGDCILCCKYDNHAPDCPYQRAVDFIGGTP